MIAYCIKTFERPKQVERLVKSIKKFDKKAKIYIADDSHEPMKGSFAMEFDSGLSAGRNLLIRKTKEPYLLFLDDDFVFSKDTKIEKLLEILEKNKELGLIGGAMRETGAIRHYEGYLKLENEVLTIDKKVIQRDGFVETGLILNFFLARRELFDSVRWDSDLKLAEHSDFFLRLGYTKWKVGYCDNVIIEHKPNKNGEYAKFRGRGKQFMRLFMKKRGIKEIISYEGKSFKN
jgi:(N-acetylneuraminyl)-galactosylglucosylceramide N-acetylgalactosaminyltransferase